ncbi:hypothetical protein AURDEDRAFT_116484 [Auricularia subglabra TFB-10046 SS5]|nr:hypothetical protein AURDEDRAFT_116484 [Auricularia subglabra TFB-10046 SS5]
MQDIFRHFPRVEDTNFPGWASYENPVFSRAGCYRDIKEWIWRSGRGLHDIPFPLDALRGRERVTLYNPLPREILGLIGQLSPPLSFVFAPDLLYPEEEFELTVSGREGSLRHSRVFIDEYRFWSRPLGSDIRKALQTALSGKTSMMFLTATHWASLVGCIPPVPGLKSVRIFADGKDDFAALAPAAFPCGDLRDLELNSRAGCVMLAQSRILEFAMGSFDPDALLRTTLTLVNVHVGGDMAAFHDVFGEVCLAHEGLCSLLDSH